ncbi:MAG: Rpn family recombination-promoting nuclease/putative transposase [Muribaculaceae bacterium]|nr:Rpn family recombination-promoting nuclease/putative transposase [Muribaculaceae bacterium]
MDQNTYIRFDWFMKHMLRDKSNFEILEGFISVLLGEDVKIEEILESEGNQESDDDKFNRVDIKAKNSKGHLIIVEVQLTRQLYYLQRILYGTCKAITEHINIGDKYDQVKKVYSISLLYCEYGQGDDYVYHGETRFKGIHTGTDLLVNTKEEGVIVHHLPKEVFPEYYLVRVNAYDKIPDTPLDEWMTYLKTGKVKENTRVPGLQGVKEKLRLMSMTIEERRAYDRHMDNIMVQNDVLDTAREEGREEGLAEGRTQGLAEGRTQGLAEGRTQGLAEGRTQGLAEGRAEGREEAMISLVENMIKMNLADEVISQATGLSVEKIQDIKRNSSSV